MIDKNMNYYLCAIDIGYGIQHKLIISSKDKMEIIKDIQKEYFNNLRIDITLTPINNLKKEQMIDIVFQET